jgi:hypothetical protein
MAEKTTGDTDRCKKVGGDPEAGEKPVLGISPLQFVDDARNRVDYNRVIEIAQGIIRHCADENQWPTEWDDELRYITNALWHRDEVGGVIFELD